MTVSNSRQRDVLLLVVIILLGMVLRLYQLDASPVRGDEAFTIQYWPASWEGALALVGIDPHPWLAYTLFAGWRTLFGTGEWVMRLLPALLNLIGIAGTYALARVLFKRSQAALLAAGLYAVHPFLIWHAQDVRDYAIWVAFAVIAAWTLTFALRGGRTRYWLLYVLTTTASTYTFFLHPFLVVAQGVYVLIARRDRLRQWAGAMLLTGVLLVPWYIMLFTAATSAYGGTASRFDVLQLVTWFLPTLAVGSTLPAPLLPALGIALCAGGMVMLAALWRQQKKSTQFALIHVLVPVLCLSAISLRMGVFRPRYVVAIVPFLLLIAAGFVGYLMNQKTPLAKLLAVSAVGMILVFDGWALVNHYTDPAFRKAPDWRTLGAFLTEHTQPDDLVVQQALDPGFTYYFRGPADETTLPLKANAPAQETVQILENALASYHAIWLIPGAPPGYDDAHVPLTWLTDNAQQTADIPIAGFRVLEFRAWEVDSEAYDAANPVDFDQTARLLDWEVEQLGDSLLRLVVYWQPLDRTPTALKGFAHLVGPLQPADNSPLWAQDDHVIPGSAADTTTWDTDAVYRDVYRIALPENLPDGSWELHVGLYNPTTMERLNIDRGDHLTIVLEDFPG